MDLTDPLDLNNVSTRELKDKARPVYHTKITILCKCANIVEVEGNKKSSNHSCKCKPWEFIESKGNDSCVLKHGSQTQMLAFS